MEHISFSNAKQLFTAYIVLHISIYYAWILFGDQTEKMYGLGSSLISSLAPIIACAVLFYVYQKSAGKSRLFWLLLSLGCFNYSIAEGIWTYSHYFSNIEPVYPGWADFFYFLQIVFYLAAFVYHLKQEKEIAYQIKFLFDIMIIIAVFTALSGHFLIQHLLPEESVATMLFIVSIGYPIGDLLLMFAAVSFYIGFFQTISRRMMGLMIAGLLFQVFADTAYLFSTFTNTYTPANLYAPFWSLGLLLVALAGLYSLDPMNESMAKKTPTLNHDRISIRMLLPYISLLLLFVSLVVEQDENTTVLFVGAGTAAILIITRQVYTMRDNRRLLFNYDQLTSVLEQKIEERTIEVTAKNEQLERAVQQTKHLANHDVLTGLPNRRLFLEKLDSSIADAILNSQQLAVVFIDLDRFKNINDSFGHEFGDILLQNFSQKIADNLRSIDIVSRQGGDEFTIILDDIYEEKDVTSMIHRLQSVLLKPLTVNGQELHISLSIGIAIYPKDGNTASELLKNADSAMYSAKAKGKNNYQFFSHDMTLSASRKVSLENDLRRAITNKDFTLHYQPQILAATGAIIGMEALIRWQKADGSTVSPGEFIPLAEETRLILPIGEWVLHTACEQAKEWHELGHSHLKLAVNLSPLQFMQDDLMDVIAQALDQTGFTASSLELEITESVAVDDAEKAIARMQALREMGVQIAIDDFGTGYSSLQYLKRFPLNNLKIAQPFVQDMATNPHDKALVEAMVFIAHSLDMSVIAEGVETIEQLTLLKELGCDEIQGYLYSRPLPNEKFTELLEIGMPASKLV